MSTRDWDARTYDRVADPQTRWGSVVLDRLPLEGDETVLDAGCGTGRVTEQLLERLPRGRVIAVDGSPSMIDAAPPDQKNRALRVMAFSYAFESNATQAETYEKQVFAALAAKPDYEGAAGVANELARIKLESGDFDGAANWYKTGYDTAMRKPDMKDSDKNLWAFRWANAQARIAVRRGKREEAQQQIVLAKSALEKANNPDQAAFLPYLTGYVAFYGGDYKTAISDLGKANQEDPFILVLLAQAYEKSGDSIHAKEYYRKVMANNGHGPTNAFARPIAKKKLGDNKS